VRTSIHREGSGARAQYVINGRKSCAAVEHSDLDADQLRGLLVKLFLPDVSKLSNLDYARVAEVSGWTPMIAPNAPVCAACARWADALACRARPWRPRLSCDLACPTVIPARVRRGPRGGRAVQPSIGPKYKNAFRDDQGRSIASIHDVVRS